MQRKRDHIVPHPLTPKNNCIAFRAFVNIKKMKDFNANPHTLLPNFLPSDNEAYLEISTFVSYQNTFSLN